MVNLCSHPPPIRPLSSFRTALTGIAKCVYKCPNPYLYGRAWPMT